MESIRLPASLFALALAVAACSPGDSGGDPTSTIGASGDSTLAVADSTPSATEDTTTTTGTGETTTTKGRASIDESCIVGSWEMDSEAFVAQLNELFASQLQGSTATFGGGSYTVTFGADGSFDGVRDNWIWRVATPEGTLVQTINSEETGTYTLENGEMRAVVDPVTFDVKSQIEVDGQLIDLPPPPGGITFDSGDFDPRGSVSCDDESLVVTADEGLELVFDKA